VGKKRKKKPVIIEREGIAARKTPMLLALIGTYWHIIGTSPYLLALLALLPF
jgi:hypothetical protein